MAIPCLKIDNSHWIFFAKEILYLRHLNSEPKSNLNNQYVKQKLQKLLISIQRYLNRQ